MPREDMIPGTSSTQLRGSAMLRHAFGPAIAAALADPDVTDILLNPDGQLWTERGGELEFTGFYMAPAHAERIIRLLATHTGQEAGKDHPIISAELPDTGERFEGLLPPVVTAPCFALRKPARQRWTLDDYVANGVMTEQVAKYVIAAVQMRRNILIIGGTGTGKTTLANALLAEIARSDDRLVILEDTRELNATSRNVVQLKSTQTVTLRHLVRSTLRLRPDRIVIGEVRGAEALDMLKAWNTGHSGGIATLHANSPMAALLRLEQLCLEAIAIPPRALIAEAVQIIVAMTGRGPARRVSDICEVAGLTTDGDYRLRLLLPEITEDSLFADLANI